MASGSVTEQQVECKLLIYDHMGMRCLSIRETRNKSFSADAAA
jgi:hypothetical protein